MWRFYARSSTLTIILILIAISTAILAQENRPAGAHEPGLVLVEQHPSPVLTVKSPGAEGNRYGFEGGNVVKLQGTYHLVTTEMSGEPFSVKTKLAHWSSNDRLHWKRVSTLYESSGELPARIRGHPSGAPCLSMMNRLKIGIRFMSPIALPRTPRQSTVPIMMEPSGGQCQK
jgi:hypothetical protein